MVGREGVLHESVTVATAAASSDEIKFGWAAFGQVYIPAGSSITSLTWYSAPTYGGTYTAAYDEDGVAVTQTVAAGKCYAVPSALAGCTGLKAVGDAAGEFDISLKG